MEAAIASVKALAAARAAEGNSWRDEGYRSPADHLAHDTGVSPAAAKRTLETGKRLAAQPEVARVKTKFTVFDLLDRLCPHHHRLKTNRGWGLVEGTGKRDFVPPGHSRHPDRAGRQGRVTVAQEGRSPPAEKVATPPQTGAI
jgi:hypothetical protein